MGIRAKRAREQRGILWRRCSKGKKTACKRLNDVIERNPDDGIVMPETAHPNYRPEGAESNIDQETTENLPDFENLFSEEETTTEDGSYPWNEDSSTNDGAYMEAKAPEINMKGSNSGAIILVVVVVALIFFMNRKASQ
jgi:hypothetical protein